MVVSILSHGLMTWMMQRGTPIYEISILVINHPSWLWGSYMKIVLFIDHSTRRGVGVPSVQRPSRFCARGVLHNELLITYRVLLVKAQNSEISEEKKVSSLIYAEHSCHTISIVPVAVNYMADPWSLNSTPQRPGPIRATPTLPPNTLCRQQSASWKQPFGRVKMAVSVRSHGFSWHWYFV